MRPGGRPGLVGCPQARPESCPAAQCRGLRAAQQHPPAKTWLQACQHSCKLAKTAAPTCSVHHQYSSRVSPFHAKQAAESRATAAAAWSCGARQVRGWGGGGEQLSTRGGCVEGSTRLVHALGLGPPRCGATVGLPLTSGIASACCACLGGEDVAGAPADLGAQGGQGLNQHRGLQAREMGWAVPTSVERAVAGDWHGAQTREQDLQTMHGTLL